MSIKVILFDIDDTLFRRDKTISPKTMEALLEVSRRGIRIGIASGRAIGSVGLIARSIPIPGIILSGCNGNCIEADGTVYYDRPMDEESFDLVASIVGERMDVMYTFGRNDYIMQGSEEAWLYIQKVFKGKGYHRKFSTYKEMSTLLGDELYHIYTRDPDNGKRLQVMKEVEEALSGRADVIVSSRDNFEVFPKGTDKGNTVHVLMEKMGYRRDEIMSFGDWNNDLGMTKEAGIGVAMGNASKEMKATADFITLGCDEDGIPYALRHFGVID